MIHYRKIAVILNGFIHDFSTGYWLACMISIVILHNFQSEYPLLSDELNIIEKFFFWNTIGAIPVILATGGIRTFTYIDNSYGQDAEITRRKMLLMKHFFLFMIFGISAYLAYTMVFR